MIIYLYGPDSGRLHESLLQMKHKFTSERDPQGLNLVDLAVAECTEAQILEQLYVAPFLAEKRMLVLRNLLVEGSKELHTTLTEHLTDQTLPEDIIVIITDGDVKPRAKSSQTLQKFLISQPYSQSFLSLKGRQLQDWIYKEVHARSGSMDRDAVAVLARYEWNDTLQLSHIIDQLIGYASGRTITVADVHTFLPQEAEDDIFALVDLVVTGKRAAAMERIRDQYRLGKDPHYIFSMLLRQYRIMLDIADILDRGEQPHAKAMGLHPFVLKKTQPLVARMTKNDIITTYKKLVDIDRQIKTGSVNPALLIDILVAST